MTGEDLQDQSEAPHKRLAQGMLAGAAGLLPPARIAGAMRAPPPLMTELTPSDFPADPGPEAAGWA